MADNGKWLKLWTSALTDPDLSDLSLEDWARWAKLGLLVKQHGDDGTMRFNRQGRVLQDLFRVNSDAEVLQTLARFPNCKVELNETTAFVSFSKWYKYQHDNSTERVREFRRNETGVFGDVKRAKKRREEKREEETKKRKENTPSAPVGGGEEFAQFWQAYPRRKSKATAERAFEKARSEATLAMILDALKRLQPEWASRAMDKIPYPATWLNAKGWEDESGQTRTAGQRTADNLRELDRRTAKVADALF